MQDDKENKIYGFVTIGSKGQIVIPADAREALGIGPGDHMFVAGSKAKGVIALIPESSADSFVQMVNKRIGDFEAVRARGPEKFED